MSCAELDLVMILSLPERRGDNPSAEVEGAGALVFATLSNGAFPPGGGGAYTPLAVAERPAGANAACTLLEQGAVGFASWT